MSTELANRARPRVLFVDDEPNVLSAFSNALRKHFAISTSTSGLQALQTIAAQGPYEVIVSDFAMPVMNGAQFLAQARYLAPDSIRILLTGHASTEHAISAVNAGYIFRFLTKPCPPADLIKAIEEAIEHRTAASAEVSVLQQKLDTMSRQLLRAERLASLGTMAGSIGHELNNMLSAFMQVIDLIHEGAESKRPPTPEDLATLELVCSHFKTHAKSLLHLAKPQTAGASAITNLCATTGEVVAMLQNAGMLRRAKIRVAMPEHPVLATIERIEFEQLLVNLVKNAIDASNAADQTHATIDLGIDGSDDSAWATCTVRDFGIGISKDHLAHLFEPYFTTKPVDTSTGLGLFVVQQIVQRRGGQITVESDPVRGTAFTVKLPIARSSF